MSEPVVRRARSAEAKQAREQAILDSARALGHRHGVRDITLTDIAADIGMHKSALLRYFETREQIFLRLTAEGWREWSAGTRAQFPDARAATPHTVAQVLARTLVERPLFCDLLAQAPLNLERNVSIESARTFKLAVLHEVHLVAAELRRLLGLDEQQAIDTIAMATSMAGALWQMANPSPHLRALYESDPALAHALVDLEPQLVRVLTAYLTGLAVGDARNGRPEAGQEAFR
ncbi:TetR/AcrR family transcriptional regulator [Streptomyces sp. J2-1]|uniref:TetR/AcrR family transcriptional regulator n=1 Tax=Streptomyces corallincola TaxID=2851888 RepID=UPI001C394B5D|nr:TetR/AcrR family transcriptional regulator [Streptomyces corallincola]MBV2358047.1 TetR/AcrR family transcriptional regulator [Streptomyces corallincola]